MITMVVSQRTDGADIAAVTVAGHRYEVTSRTGAIMGLARQLVAAGFQDSPWQTVGSDGGVRLHGASLHGLAKLTTIEDKQGIHIRPFKPFHRHEGLDAPMQRADSPAAFRSPPLSLHPDGAKTAPAAQGTRALG